MIVTQKLTFVEHFTGPHPLVGSKPVSQISDKAENAPVTESSLFYVLSTTQFYSTDASFLAPQGLYYKTVYSRAEFRIVVS